MVQEEQQSPEKQELQQHQQQLIVPPLLFDIGEPSEASQIQAMMELDIDISKGLVSQKSSSIAQSTTTPEIQQQQKQPQS